MLRRSEVEARDLAILDAASGPGVLPLDPSGAIALLNVAGLVHHQDRSRVAQVPSDVIPQVIADRIGVPAGPAEQMLHPVRGEVRSPACSAIVQQFLRGRSASSPKTSLRARRRGSTHTAVTIYGWSTSACRAAGDCRKPAPNGNRTPCCTQRRDGSSPVNLWAAWRQGRSAPTTERDVNGQRLKACCHAGSPTLRVCADDGSVQPYAADRPVMGVAGSTLTGTRLVGRA